MTKRASGKFKRNARDLYDTPESAVLPLLPHIHRHSYYEPCIGNGALVNGLAAHGIGITGASDITTGRDARSSTYDLRGADCFITNPPWSRDILHPIIYNLSHQAPTWLLFDSDWMHTKQAIPFLDDCLKIVSVGRVSWMGNGVSGFDNCCWYLFHQGQAGTTRFYQRRYHFDEYD